MYCIQKTEQNSGKNVACRLRYAWPHLHNERLRRRLALQEGEHSSVHTAIELSTLVHPRMKRTAGSAHIAQSDVLCQPVDEWAGNLHAAHHLSYSSLAAGTKAQSHQRRDDSPWKRPGLMLATEKRARMSKETGPMVDHRPTVNDDAEQEVASPQVSS
jgi:hypothetical protein